jgi:hypothetical protein
MCASPLSGCNVRAGLAVCTAVVLDDLAKLLLHHAALSDI